MESGGDGPKGGKGEDEQLSEAAVEIGISGERSRRSRGGGRRDGGKGVLE